MGTPGGRLTLFCLRTRGEGGCINDALQLPVGFVMATPEARGSPGGEEQLYSEWAVAFVGPSTKRIFGALAQK